MMIFNLLIVLAGLGIVAGSAGITIAFSNPTSFAGTTLVDGNDGNGGPATSATLGHPSSIWMDYNEHMFIADPQYSVIRKVDGSGIITRYAGGTGNTVYQVSEEGDAATNANLDHPRGVWGNTAYLFIADTGNYRVRQVSFADGSITTLVGTGVQGDSTTEVFNPYSGFWNTVSHINYVTDLHGCVIRSITGNPAVLTTVAGTFRSCQSATHSGADPLTASIGKPYSLTGDNLGNMYFSEYDGHLMQTFIPGSPSSLWNFPLPNTHLDHFTGVYNDQGGHMFYLTKAGTLGWYDSNSGSSGSATPFGAYGSENGIFLKSLWANTNANTLYVADAKHHVIYAVPYTITNPPKRLRARRLQLKET